MPEQTNDDSLFGQFANEEDFRPAVMDISEATPALNAPSN